MFDKIKGNLKEIIATVAIIGAIGGGFIKYGEIMSKIDSIDPAKAGQIKQDLAIAQKEIELLKIQMKELRASSSNPLARWVIKYKQHSQWSIKRKLSIKTLMAKKNLENKHIRKPPKKRKGRHTKRVNKNKTYKPYVGQGRWLKYYINLILG